MNDNIHPMTSHEERGWQYSFLNLGTESGWMAKNTLLKLYPWNGPSNYCTGGWVRPRVSLDWCGKYRPYREWIVGHSRYTDCSNPAHPYWEILHKRGKMRL